MANKYGLAYPHVVCTAVPVHVAAQYVHALNSKVQQSSTSIVVYTSFTCLLFKLQLIDDALLLKATYLARVAATTCAGGMGSKLYTSLSVREAYQAPGSPSLQTNARSAMHLVTVA